MKTTSTALSKYIYKTRHLLTTFYIFHKLMGITKANGDETVVSFILIPITL